MPEIEFGKGRYSNSYATSMARKFKSFSLSSAGYVNQFFGTKLLSYFSLPFDKWPAFKMGIISDEGDELRNANNREERDEWNYATMIVDRLKQMINYQMDDGRIKLLYDRLFLVRESNNDMKYVNFLNDLYDMGHKDINDILDEMTVSGNMATSCGGLSNDKDLARDIEKDTPDPKKKKKLRN